MENNLSRTSPYSLPSDDVLFGHPLADDDLLLSRIKTEPEEPQQQGTKNKAVKKTTCAVCQEVSNNHHTHYGALVCYSCRAFFRRANQSNAKSSGYVCKYDNRCDITSSNRKKCQKCRYERCVAVGMDPSLVLTEDQKKTRFRKMLEKKTTAKENGDDLSPSASPLSLESTSPKPEESRRKSPSLAPTLTEIELALKRRKVEEDFGQVAEPLLGPETARISSMLFEKQKSEEALFTSLFHSDKPESNKANNVDDLQCDTLQELESVLSLATSEKTTTTAPLPQTASLPSTPIMHNPRDRVARLFADLLQHPEADQWQQARSHHRPSPQATHTSGAYERQYEQHQEFKQPVISSVGHNTLLKAPQWPSSPHHYLGAVKMQEYCYKNPYFYPPHPTTAPSSYGTFPLVDAMPATSFPTQIKCQPVIHQLDGSGVRRSGHQETVHISSPEESPKAISKQRKAEESVPLLVQLLGDYQDALNDVSDRDFFQTMVSFHQDEDGQFNGDNLKKLINHLASIFNKFASHQATFHRLDVLDQFKLQAVNRPLFVHFVLAKYFQASSGKTQLRWLFGNHPKIPAHGLHAKSLDNVYDKVEPLIDSDSKATYSELVRDVDNLIRYEVESCGIVCAFILFSTFAMEDDAYSGNNGKTSRIAKAFYQLTGTEKVKEEYDRIANELKTWAEYREMEGQMVELMAMLVEMRNTFVGHKPNKDRAEIIPKQLEMPFTAEENKWLNRQLKKYKEAYSEVRLDEEFIEEFFMFSCDVPLSKAFGFRGYSAFQERFRRILKSHPGYEELSLEEQKEVWKSGSSKAIALCSVKSEQCTNGLEQLEFLSGDSSQSWRSKYDALIDRDGNKVKKIQMTDYNRATSIFDSHELTDYLRLIGSLGEIAVDDEVFDIVTLVSLFCDEDAQQLCQTKGGNRFSAELRNRYLTVLRRKLKEKPSTFSKINIGLAEIDQLATILKKLSV